MSIVYSTETGRIRPPKPPKEKPHTDGIVRITRQTSGRKGKGVCIITGLDLSDVQLKELATQLKKRCGCGGAVKNHTIEIQGDNQALLKQLLEQQGYQVKLAGGR